MTARVKSSWADTKTLFRSIPSVTLALFTLSVVLMNLLANKTIFESAWIAIDGGIVMSWLTFLCMDVVTKAFGPKAAVKMTVFALIVNLFVCLIFYLVSIIPTETDYSGFNLIFGGTWFILLSSSVAFLASGIVNSVLNWAVGRLFRRNPDGKLAYVCRCYVSTFVAQFVDNLLFALLTFMVFAPVFWNGYSWTFLQCVSCALLGALLELLMEVVFSPIGYRVLKSWKRDGIGGYGDSRKMSVSERKGV